MLEKEGPFLIMSSSSFRSHNSRIVVTKIAMAKVLSKLTLERESDGGLELGRMELRGKQKEMKEVERMDGWSVRKMKW